MFINLNNNITEFFMSDKLLTLKQDKKQFNIFSKSLSKIITMNHTKIIMINKATEKDSVINIIELQIIVNFIIYKIIIINYEALKETHTINTAKL